MADAQIMSRLGRVFEDALDMPAPAPDRDILEAGMIDSLGMVTLLFEIEQEFAVQIPMDTLDIEDLRTTERIATLIGQLKEASPA